MALTQISTAGVKDDAVTAGKIPANAVGSSELADNAVDTAAIATDAVTGPKIADDAIGSNHYVDGSINAAHLNSSAVTTSKLNNNAVDATKIADGAVTAAKLASGVQTTINNNADNRVITGSGTANTLEGESNLTFTSNVLKVQNGVSDGNDSNLLHLVAGGTATRGLMIGTGSSTGASQNDGMCFYDAINSESNEYGSQHIFRRGGHNNMVIGYQSNNFVGIQTDYPTSAIHVTDTNPVIGQFHHSDGGTNDQARISLGALANNPPSNRGVNLVGLNNGAGHDFVVQCSASHGLGPTEAFRVHSNGDITVPSGSIKLSESGQGINFHAHGSGTNIDSNVLDDYEEGTFTPVYGVSDSALSGFSTSSNYGHYIKIGHVVHVAWWTNFTATPSNSNALQLQLPFTSKNHSGYRGGMPFSFSGISYVGHDTYAQGGRSHIGSNTQWMELGFMSFVNGGTWTSSAITPSVMNNNANFQGEGTYIAA